MSIASEELDKQVAEFLAKGGTIKTVSKQSKPRRLHSTFEQGEYNQVLDFISLSTTPVLFSDITLYMDFPKSKVRSILACAESKGKLNFKICPRHKFKLWSVVK